MTHAIFFREAFKGSVEAHGSLSNEPDLLRLCPPEYHGMSNEWRTCVELLRSSEEVDTSGWVFKTDNVEEREKQRLYICVMLWRPRLPEKMKAVVAGMMDAALKRPPK